MRRSPGGQRTRSGSPPTRTARSTSYGIRRVWRSVTLLPLNVKLLGFEMDRTYPCLRAAERRGRALEDERLSLLGNSFLVPSVAWLLGQRLAQLGFLPRAPLISELNDPLRPWLWGQQLPDDEETRLLWMARAYTSQQGHRGGEIRLDGLAAKGRRGRVAPLDPRQWWWGPGGIRASTSTSSRTAGSRFP